MTTEDTTKIKLPKKQKVLKDIEFASPNLTKTAIAQFGLTFVEFPHVGETVRIPILSKLTLLQLAQSVLLDPSYPLFDFTARYGMKKVAGQLYLGKITELSGKGMEYQAYLSFDEQ